MSSVEINYIQLIEAELQRRRQSDRVYGRLLKLLNKASPTENRNGMSVKEAKAILKTIKESKYDD